MPEFTFLIKNVGDPDSSAWKEDMNVPDGTDPAEYGRAIVKQFNSQEKDIPKRTPKYTPKYREFVSVLDATGRIFCDFYKVNASTVVKGMSNYDIYRCKRCLMYYQQFGLTGRPGTIECRPDLTCTECNRVFKTAKMLERHNKLNKHKEPSWLPDGV